MMVGYFLRHPIAVCLAFFVSICIGIFLFQKIPVSLLPNIEVSRIVIKISYPNNSLDVIEQNITKPIRESMLSVSNISNVESETTHHTSTITLTFEQGSKMDLAYIAVNEKLDFILSSLPKDLQRPQVIRVNTSDIPIVNLQVIPKNQADYIEVVQLTDKVLRKRVEQIEGVSIVDVNGKQAEAIVIQPDLSALAAVNLNETDLEKAIVNANNESGALSVKDGQYRYFVKLSNRIDHIGQISNIPLRLKDGTITTIGQFVSLSYQVQSPQGYHLFNGKRGLNIKIQKQASSRMHELMPKIDALLKAFKQDYPTIDFSLTQNQYYLLDQGIQNLTQDLWYGGIFCVLLLFLFIGNIGSPLLMSISIPVSLLISFIFFYLFDISLNIISLSGMALGIGMLIDNSIVVLDNINRKRNEGLSIEDSCIVGVNEVVSPVIGNVLTTVAIYAPLIYMSGFAGELVSDQAIALTISLAVSLLIAFCLNPVMYSLFFKAYPQRLNEDTRFFLLIFKGYQKMIAHIFDYKIAYLLLAVLLMPIGFILFSFIPIATLPKLQQTETQIKIDWNVPIDAEENLRRVQLLGEILNKQTILWEADAGIKQYILQQGTNSIQHAEIYFKASSEDKKDKIDKQIDNWFKASYPDAIWVLQPAPNAFTQLFENSAPYFEARFKSFKALSQDSVNNQIENILKVLGTPYRKGLTFSGETKIELNLLPDRMALYNVSTQDIQLVLKKVFGKGSIAEIKRFGEVTAIRFSSDDKDIFHKLRSLVRSADGQYYALSTFVRYTAKEQPKFILADQSGSYSAISFEQAGIADVPLLKEKLETLARKNGLFVSFSGEYFFNESLMEDLVVIFAISLLLLYFILAVQFEHLIYPFLVMLTIPLGITGAMLVLWLSGGTFNVMAAIGFIVVLGIIVDDPSLKIETINRLRKEYREQGLASSKETLMNALHGAGKICLKPLLMVSLTTSLALLPVLFSGGIGNDLQKPLVYVIIGGLTVGTFFTLWFIPLAYWFITKKEK